ncbi:MAG: DotI/IcmL family type IV secretion protein [Alphaproteobacteria bacterium]
MADRAQTGNQNGASAGGSGIAAQGQAAGATKPLSPKKSKVKKGFFSDDAVAERLLQHPDKELRRHQRLVTRIKAQSFILVVLILTYLAAIPFFATTQLYYVRRVGQPLGSEQRVRGLHIPILTQGAILSWASTAVTEIMTFNFADYNQRLSSFSNRFLPDSWLKFVDALLKQDTINKFKSFNLVMTAAPSEPAIIASEGPDDETGEYQWVVQVPVVLNYVTNNNKRTRNNHVIELTLVRVSTLENAYGIAIKTWIAK